MNYPELGIDYSLSFKDILEFINILKLAIDAILPFIFYYPDKGILSPAPALVRSEYDLFFFLA